MSKIKAVWDYLQDLLDIRGDVVMLVFTGAVIYRIIAARYGGMSLGPSEAAVYASAVTCFAWSNKP